MGEKRLFASQESPPFYATSGYDEKAARTGATQSMRMEDLNRAPDGEDIIYEDDPDLERDAPVTP